MFFRSSRLQIFFAWLLYLQLLLVSCVVCRPRFLRQHEGVQVAHLRQSRLDVLHVHLHRVLELGQVLGPQPGLDLGQGVLQGLQLERISATREISSEMEICSLYLMNN